MTPLTLVNMAGYLSLYLIYNFAYMQHLSWPALLHYSCKDCELGSDDLESIIQVHIATIVAYKALHLVFLDTSTLTTLFQNPSHAVLGYTKVGFTNTSSGEMFWFTFSISKQRYPVFLTVLGELLSWKWYWVHRSAAYIL